jgi:hypothetical protein
MFPTLLGSAALAAMVSDKTGISIKTNNDFIFIVASIPTKPKMVNNNKLMIKPQVGKIQVTVGLLKNLAFSDLDLSAAGEIASFVSLRVRATNWLFQIR